MKYITDGLVTTDLRDGSIVVLSPERARKIAAEMIAAAEVAEQWLASHPVVRGDGQA